MIHRSKPSFTLGPNTCRRIANRNGIFYTKRQTKTGITTFSVFKPVLKLFWILCHKFGISGNDGKVYNLDQSSLFVHGLSKSKSWKAETMDQQVSGAKNGMLEIFKNEIFD